MSVPPGHFAWLTDLSRGRLDAVRARGYSRHADPETLVPGPDSAAPMPVLDERELVQELIS